MIEELAQELGEIVSKYQDKGMSKEEIISQFEMIIWMLK